ncbi:MAG: ribosome small subunit-dependent GTPase A [candidate division Zixibacteria bacterium]|nr:ribosome small subunit-dependent GTPase A [candidate division Zixibacteria bacterium]
MIEPNTRKGKIIEALGSSFKALSGEEILDCFHRGKFRIAEVEEKYPVVGDDVEILETPNGFMINRIFPRRTKISRAAVGTDNTKEQVLIANLEQCVIVSSIDEPPFKPRLIDRMLVSALKGNLKPVIVLNKLDLLENFNLDFWRSVYESIGYTFIAACALTGEGIVELKKELSGTVSVFTGHSGVGKSSLLNQIKPGLGVATKDISRSTGKGRHTTTRVTMYPIDDNSFVVDTPGLKELGLWKVDKSELELYFEEFRPYINECKFRDCLHLSEPQCAVKNAVKSDVISEVRYESYRRILETLPEKSYEKSRG